MRLKVEKQLQSSNRYIKKCKTQKVTFCLAG